MEERGRYSVRGMHEEYAKEQANLNALKPNASKEVGPLQSWLEETSKAAHEAHEELDRLTARLGPVLRPEQEVPVHQGVPVPINADGDLAHSQVMRQVGALNSLLRGLSLRISDLSGRAEV